MLLFTKHHVLTKAEMVSRYEILLEDYCKTIHIEARTMAEILQKELLPSIFSYMSRLASTGIKAKELVPTLSVTAEEKLLTALNEKANGLSKHLDTLRTLTKEAEVIKDELAAGSFYHDVILPELESIRLLANEAEVLIPESILPYPTYDTLLFSL